MSPRVAAQQTFVRFEVNIPTKLISQVDSSELNFSTFVSPDSQAMGDQWLEHGTGAALNVPSAVIPEESNYLLNPAHPKFNQIIIGEPETFAFDPRLIR